MEIENTILSEITKTQKYEYGMYSLVDSSHKQRMLRRLFVILEKLSNKVNPKKNIYRSSWKLEADKIDKQKLGA